ncbi:DegV family protein [Paenibacillus senegalensis]|uniref:DegV family protein n=1 Tax=Paenibacillus senegalensis TaxID=1465766 RepID=UPI0002895CA5|nr:DegV family protein [Paenibacillus senegalensis]
MSKIRIVTDSTADIPAEIREKLGISMVPLKVHFDKETYIDSVTIQADEFYKKLAAFSGLPTTSQPSPVDFVDIYKDILKDDPDTHIISIHLSAAMSGTYQSAVLAKSLLEEQGEQVTVVDSKSASYGFGWLVVLAAEAVNEGKSKEEILDIIYKNREEMALYFLVDTLEYLQKGGRIGKAAAFLGTLLNIKPILSIDDEGEVTSVEKARGQKKAMNRLIELTRAKHGDKEVNVIIAHAASLGTAEELKELVQAQLKVKSVSFTTVGPVIGTHAGPGTIAIFALPG